MSRRRKAPVVLERVREFVRRHTRLIQSAAVVVSVVAAVILVRSLPVEQPLDALRDQIEKLGVWGPVVFILAFVVLTSLLLPGWPLNVLAGVVFGALWGGALSVLASVLAATGPFLLGRYVLRDWLTGSLWRTRKMQAVYRALDAEPDWKVVAAFRLSHALPYGLQNYLLGVMPVGFLSFLLTTLIVTLPGTFFVAYLGHVGRSLQAAELPSDSVWTWVARGAGLLVAVAAISYVGRVIRKGLKEHGVHGLDAAGLAEPERRGRVRPGWPWLSLAALSASLLLLGGATWWYFEG